MISETWLEDKLKLPDGNFQIYQTRHNAHKGVAIIVKNSIESKEEPLEEYDSCFKLISLRRNNQIKAYILGCYICPTNKKKLLNICKECVNKIRMKTKYAQIILAGDFNLNPKDMNLFSTSQNLHIVNNSSITTRSQKFKNQLSCSTLDYILSNAKPLDFKKIEDKADSDHFPIMCKLTISNISRSIKTYKFVKIIRRASEEQITSL